MSQPEQYQSTGHGTVDVPWSQDTKDSLKQNQGQTSDKQQSQQQNQQQPQQHNASSGFGHTTHQGHSRRSIKRDLNDI
ncbi:hypothetical protein EDC96DRAFT_577002 [Choanephora cucurbitarum]|nr:hypothetical protein EDC96DRAFT_577002 [Choanephora cucurbitarum]